MAVPTSFFGKRDNDAFNNRSTPGATTVPGASPSSSPAAPAAGVPSSVARPVGSSFAEDGDSGGSKLTVGPNIKLKGVEITDCDTLVVEGTVEATMDSRVIQIAEHGAFHGTAEIDIAEIRGVFDGTLTVRQKLVIYGTGKVSGKIRYGKVVIEEGGELSGQIEAGTSAASKPATPAPASSSSSFLSTPIGSSTSSDDGAGKSVSAATT